MISIERQLATLLNETILYDTEGDDAIWALFRALPMLEPLTEFADDVMNIDGLSNINMEVLRFVARRLDEEGAGEFLVKSSKSKRDKAAAAEAENMRDDEDDEGEES